MRDLTFRTHCPKFNRYEFITKNHNWTSKLARIWHVFRKLGSFWLFLSAPVQAASVLEHSKGAQFSKMCQKRPNFDVQLWNWFLVINYVCMKFAYIVTGLVFHLSYWILDNLIYLLSGHNGCFSYFSLKIVFWLIFNKNN